MPLRARLRVENYDEVVAAYERLGFARVKAWDGRGRGRSALFRAGPSYVEVAEASVAPVALPGRSHELARAG